MSEIIASLSQWTEWAEQGYTRFPYVLRSTLEKQPDSWLEAWQESSPYAFVLESGKEGRYTFLGLEAESILQGKGAEARVTNFARATGRKRNGEEQAGGAGVRAKVSAYGGSGTERGGEAKMTEEATRARAAGTAEAKGPAEQAPREAFPDADAAPQGARAVGDSAGMEGSLRRGTPVEAIRGWMEPHRGPRVPGAPKFCGGAVGFLAYDVARSLERLPELAGDDLGAAGLPDYAFMRVRELWIVDHAERSVYCAVQVPLGELAGAEAAETAAAQPGAFPDAAGCASGNERPEQQAAPVGRAALKAAYAQAARDAERMLERWRRFERAEPAHSEARRAEIVDEAERQLAGRLDADGFETKFAQAEFEEAVRRIQEYIRSGDVFQVNLSLRKQRRLKASPEEIYEWMRIVNPSPYMGFLRFPGFQLVSGSPELLVRLEDGRLAARPIAGTRRRGADKEEDLRMAEELAGSEKERAEHIMLVDLQRNDLGRAAAYGSVVVPELMTIERYAHVMHLVSQVEADLAPGKTAYDVIAAVFPGGTITGAPKVRTMQIVEELEPVRRGPYTGSMGWIDYSGNMELNIIIRTLVVQDGIGHMQAGAGIVIDSEPYREYRECYNKARSVSRAVFCAELGTKIAYPSGQGDL
ncbi:anthranilate synthase component I family protein [Saccharibacillus sp. CPCC 101409]|uniref:anthranilate synthase component I family protein n=1 Tax=Saccharibacillus sp. CPCC 101409 TaxID=3058041 RepID=UPI002672D92D|nr:anthranilate synthase component I family protein [Saccharibacillus sp. CPCC 101409]MDO3412885.1 anthranilate synthase component I family protein [Saccharibacillus sp. CPCC 101409]